MEREGTFFLDAWAPPLCDETTRAFASNQVVNETIPQLPTQGVSSEWVTYLASSHCTELVISKCKKGLRALIGR